MKSRCRRLTHESPYGYKLPAPLGTSLPAEGFELLCGAPWNRHPVVFVS